MFYGQSIRLALISAVGLLALNTLGCNEAEFSRKSFDLSAGSDASKVRQGEDKTAGIEDEGQDESSDGKVVADIPVLWPPNHKMVLVSLAPSVEGDSCSIKSVSSNEADSGLGVEDVEVDYEIVGDLQVNLRSERFGDGDGRVYEVSLECSNSKGEAYSEVVKVECPHDMGN
ncbi:MAG: hypothetical protein AB7T49_10350 [Oligoflexales bacterium]